MLILGILEDEPDHSINVANDYVYFVVEMEVIVKLVPDLDLGLWDVLGDVPEALGGFGLGLFEGALDAEIDALVV